MNSASLCSLAGRYNNPIPTRFLAPIGCLKIPAQAWKMALEFLKNLLYYIFPCLPKSFRKILSYGRYLPYVIKTDQTDQIRNIGENSPYHTNFITNFGEKIYVWNNKGVMVLLFSHWQESRHGNGAGIFKESMGDRNRVGIGLSY